LTRKTTKGQDSDRYHGNLEETILQRQWLHWSLLV